MFVAILGDRRIEVAGGDGPEIQIKVYGLFSDVKVTDRPGHDPSGSARQNGCPAGSR